MLDDALGRAARSSVRDAALGEDDGSVVQDVGIEREVVALGVDELRLRPGLSEVVRLRDPRVAAGRTVERDVDVATVCHSPRAPACRSTTRCRRSLTGALHVFPWSVDFEEHGVEAVQVRGVDSPVFGTTSIIGSYCQEPLHAQSGLRVAPSDTAIRRPLQAMYAGRTVPRTGLRFPDPSDQEVDVGSVRVSGDRRLPVVLVGRRRRARRSIPQPGRSRLVGDARRFRSPCASWNASIRSGRAPLPLLRPRRRPPGSCSEPARATAPCWSEPRWLVPRCRPP